MDKVEEEEGSKDAEDQEEVMRVEGKVEGEVGSGSRCRR